MSSRTVGSKNKNATTNSYIDKCWLCIKFCSVQSQTSLNISNKCVFHDQLIKIRFTNQKFKLVFYKWHYSPVVLLISTVLVLQKEPFCMTVQTEASIHTAAQPRTSHPVTASHLQCACFLLNNDTKIVPALHCIILNNRIMISDC